MGSGLAEAHAIFGYTSILFYKKLNELLRSGDHDKTTLLKSLLERALAKLPLDQAIQYRAIDVSDEKLVAFLESYKLNSVVSYVDFLSAAQHRVQPFWEGSNIRFTLKPATARNITELAFGTHFIEIQSKGTRRNDGHESLFPPGARFLVESVEQREEAKKTGPGSTEDGLKAATMRTIYYITLNEIEGK